MGPEALEAAGGLRVHATLHLELQEAAETLAREDGMRGRGRGQCAAVVACPRSGAVRVHIGSRDFAASAYDRATEARRAAGSAFKPVVYLAAFEDRVVSPGSEVRDEDLVFRPDGSGWRAMTRDELDAELGARVEAMRAQYEQEGGKDGRWVRVTAGEDEREVASEGGEEGDYMPGALARRSVSAVAPASGPRGRLHCLGNPVGRFWNRYLFRLPFAAANYSRRFRGRVTVEQALAESLNLPAVDVGSRVGVGAVVRMARELGVQSPLRPTLSLCLGGSEVTPFEMASAYNTVASGGVRTRPFYISRVLDATGKEVFRAAVVPRRVVSRRACRELHRCLVEAAEKSLGRGPLRDWGGGAVAGKTGTSDAYRWVVQPLLESGPNVLFGAYGRRSVCPRCRDAWFVGYTGKATCVVWCGNDDGAPLAGTGAMLAGPLWTNIMRAASLNL